MLEDHTNRASFLSQFGIRHFGQILAVDDDGPGSRAVEKVDAANQRALTGAASADNAEDIAGFDVDVYILTGKEFSFTVSSIVFLRYVF